MNVCFKASLGTPPPYECFWSPNSSKQRYLNHLYRVRSGRLYRVSGFPLNTLRTSVEGEWIVFGRIAKAALYRKGKNSSVYVPVNTAASINGPDNFNDMIVFTIEGGGKLHIRYNSVSYPLTFTRCGWAELDMVRLWELE